VRQDKKAYPEAKAPFFAGSYAKAEALAYLETKAYQGVVRQEIVVIETSSDNG
jgi:hypothetical protein